MMVCPDGKQSPPVISPQETLEALRHEGSFATPQGLKLCLAKEFGFCPGVSRAVDLALAAAQESAARESANRESANRESAECGARLYLAGEIIHNPHTNRTLSDAGVLSLPGDRDRRRAMIQPADRVIVPAFGLPVEEMDDLLAVGCRIIDTTCAWVKRIWRAAAEFTAAGATVVLHGKREHAETRATLSRITGPYVVIRDLEEAEILARAVRRDDIEVAGIASHNQEYRWPHWFMQEFKERVRPGFDPVRDLTHLGLVNQTTMLCQDSEAIAGILEAAIAARARAGGARASLRVLDTFCPATQSRQDAIRDLLDRERPAVMLVVGGFGSSNTRQLARLGAARTRCFHIEDAGCLLDALRIRHLPGNAAAPEISRGWLPAPPGPLGLTAGASTPDRELERVIERVIELGTARGKDAVR